MRINPKKPAEVRNGSMIGGYCAIDLLIAIALAWVSFLINTELKEEKDFKNRSTNYLESDYEINLKARNNVQREQSDDLDFYK